MNEHTIYDHVGGDAPFQRLIDAFYVGIEQE
ncbi:MAG: globin, partial [Roseiflexaceae bacterium]|nr:globin [Roseiflexaceae bacterium]